MARPSVDDQVDLIVRMMASGQWRGMATRAELAVQWGCHPRTVGDRAVIASALLKRVGGPLEDWVQEKLAELDEVKATAMRLMKPIVVGGIVELHNFPDVKAAIGAIRTQLEIRGALGKRTDKGDASGEYEQLTPDQRIEAHQAAIDMERKRTQGASGEPH